MSDGTRPAPAHGIGFGEALRVWARIARATAIFNDLYDSYREEAA